MLKGPGVHLNIKGAGIPGWSCDSTKGIVGHVAHGNRNLRTLEAFMSCGCNHARHKGIDAFLFFRRGRTPDFSGDRRNRSTSHQPHADERPTCDHSQPFGVRHFLSPPTDTVNTAPLRYTATRRQAVGHRKGPRTINRFRNGHSLALTEMEGDVCPSGLLAGWPTRRGSAARTAPSRGHYFVHHMTATCTAATITSTTVAPTSARVARPSPRVAPTRRSVLATR
jgi:hypothetical protein